MQIKETLNNDKTAAGVFADTIQDTFIPRQLGLAGDHKKMSSKAGVKQAGDFYFEKNI